LLALRNFKSIFSAYFRKMTFKWFLVELPSPFVSPGWDNTPPASHCIAYELLAAME
jgi:hypothetical protein